MKPLLKKYSDLNSLNNEIAIAIETYAKQCVKQKGFFTIVLSGGKTPVGLYSRLSESPFIDSIPWNKTHFFWGDERCVAPDSKQSNFATAYESLLSKISVPKENIYRINGLLEPTESSQVYESEIVDFFQSRKTDIGFDLTLLGLGSDGHTASLFPHNPELCEKEKLVVHTIAPKGVTPSHRITMTFNLINKSHLIYFIISNKSDIIIKVLNNQNIYPATMVKPRTLPIWFIHEQGNR